MDIGIRNYQGQLINGVERINYGPGKSLNQINLGELDLSQGMYYLDVQNDGYHAYRKFIYIK